MKVRQIIVMDGEEIDFDKLNEEEYQKMEERLNAAALRQAGYEAASRQKHP